MGRTRRARVFGGAAAAVAGGLALYAQRLRAARVEQDRRLRDAEHRAEAATAEGAHGRRTRDVLQITDAALSTLPLEELLVELLARVRRAHGDARLPGDDRGEALLFCERGNRYRPAGGPG